MRAERAAAIGKIRTEWVAPWGLQYSSHFSYYFITYGHEGLLGRSPEPPTYRTHVYIICLLASKENLDGSQSLIKKNCMLMEYEASLSLWWHTCENKIYRLGIEQGFLAAAVWLQLLAIHSEHKVDSTRLVAYVVNPCGKHRL